MKGKLSLKHKVMLAGLVVAFLVVLGAGPHTAYGQTSNDPPVGKVRFFDPFTLTTIYVDAPQILANPSGDSPSGSGTASPAGVNPSAVVSGAVIVQSPIRIPQDRPPRSPHKPPKPPKPPK